MDKQKLIVVRGVPGSGKSTFSKKMFPDFENFENDMYHMKNGKYVFDVAKQPAAVKWCFDQTKKALLAGKSVVVSNTFVKRQYIDVYRDLADEIGCDFEVYTMHGRYDNVHNVPAPVLAGMSRSFQKYDGEIDVFINPDTGEYSFKENA